jgi:hypothetical protein
MIYHKILRVHKKKETDSNSETRLAQTLTGKSNRSHYEGLEATSCSFISR